MPERINQGASTTASRFIAVAAALGGKTRALHGRLLVNVQLLVEGEEVPFQMTLNQMEAELRDAMEDRAQERALELITEAGLGEAMSNLAQARRSVQRALQEIRERTPDERPRAEKV